MDAGACTNCDAGGMVGGPCATPHCVRRGLHFIPREDADAERQLPPSQLEGLVGTMVGEFLILRRLGRGGFGRVLLGLQRPLFRLRAAVKVLERDATQTPRMRALMLEKFENEARTLAVLRHPNVVGLLQYGRLGEEPFLAMEYIPGGRTIASEVDVRAERGEVLDIAVTHRLLDQVLRGLEAAHREGVIHRDLKPNNIMLETIDGDPWHVKVVDFGLAKDFAASDESSVMIGTPAYMAPEQALRKQMGPWTDLYSVGVMAIEMLTGRSLFRGTSEEILHQKLAPPALFADVAWSEPLARALVTTLAPRPEDRFQTAAAVRQALLANITPGAVTLLTPATQAADPWAATAMDGGLGGAAGREGLMAPTRAATPGAVRAATPEGATGARVLPPPSPTLHKGNTRRWLAGGGTLLVAAGVSAFVVASVGTNGSGGTGDKQGAAPAPGLGGAVAADDGDRSAKPTAVVASGTRGSSPPAAERIAVAGISAASFLPAWKGFTFAPANAIDGTLATSWQPDARRGFGLGQWLELELPGATRVARIEIDAGFQDASQGPEAIDYFCANASPRAVSVYPDGGPPWRGVASDDGRHIVITPPAGPSGAGADVAKTLTMVTDAARVGAKWGGDLAVSEVRVFGERATREAVRATDDGPVACGDVRMAALRRALVRGCGEASRDARPTAACVLWRALLDRCGSPGLWPLEDVPGLPDLVIPGATWKSGRVALHAVVRGHALDVSFTRQAVTKRSPVGAPDDAWTLGTIRCAAPAGAACALTRDVFGLPVDIDPELAPAGACKSL